MTPHEPTPTAPIGVSVKQAASITSLSQWTIRNEVSAGRIPARQIGSRVVIDYAGLVAWIESHPVAAREGEPA